MQSERRKTTYRLYPKPRQAEALEEQRRLHQRLYNALLEQRIDAYRKQRVSLNFAAQCREITALRRELPEYKALHAHSQQVTAKRVDLAFRAFFRRVKEGARRAGFPRFKSIARYPGFGYKAHGDGWRLDTGAGGKHGHMRIKGVGNVRLRGKARFEGTPKTCEIKLKNGRWYASVTFAVTPVAVARFVSPHAHGRAIGLDWGVETFATVAEAQERAPGLVNTYDVDNPRHGRVHRQRLTRLAREVSRKKRGSSNRKKAVAHLAKAHRKLANIRHDFLHQTSNRLVGRAEAIVTEKLHISNMTRSAKGTIEKPGKNVRQKGGLNREILDTAPDLFLQMLRYKAEEAGIAYLEVSTKAHAPSQTCHGCGRRVKKILAQRRHRCECGAECGRDENAARVLAGLWGREPALCGGIPLGVPMKQETPSKVA